MRYLFIILCTFSLLNTSIAQTTKTIKTKPNKAIVYLSGAELTHQEYISLPSGFSEIILENVSPYLDENSISAYFKGAMIIDTKKNLHYPEQSKKNNDDKKYIIVIQRINDSIEEMDYLIKDCNNKYTAFEKEKNLLLNNRLIKGEFSKDSIGLLKSCLDLIRTRLSNIDEEQLLIERKTNKLNKTRQKLAERLEYIELLQSEDSPFNNPNKHNPIHQIVVTLEAAQAVSGNLTIKYYVKQAGWMPMYDIQASSGKDKIQLIYRAQVYQNTGLDWKDISLILSTSNPALGNTKPVLTEWNLFFGYPNSYYENLNKNLAPSVNFNSYNNIGNYKLESKKLTTSDDATDLESEEGAIPVFTVSDNFLRTEYEIKTKYSIVSDNKAHHVIINNLEIPVKLAYMTVPKLDKDAFLMGKIVDWEDLNLIPASARIYFDESYIGTTTVEPTSTKDTLYINLGRDRSIMVKRLNIKEKCKETFIEDQKVVTKTIEITVRNTKGISLDFEIEDQIPISNDPNIKIKLIDSDDATYNEVTGKLTWKKTIRSKETKKVRFTYEVRYPKDKFVSGL